LKAEYYDGFWFCVAGIVILGSLAIRDRKKKKAEAEMIAKELEEMRDERMSKKKED